MNIGCYAPSTVTGDSEKSPNIFSVCTIIFAILFLIIASVSCTKAVKLQPSDYEDHQGGLLYRVHMSSGCTYLVASFTANDSTVVIKSLHSTDKPHADQCASVPSTPFEIKRQHITSIEKVEPGIGTPIVVISLLAFVIIGAALAGVASGSN